MIPLSGPAEYETLKLSNCTKGRTERAYPEGLYGGEGRVQDVQQGGGGVQVDHFGNGHGRLEEDGWVLVGCKSSMKDDWIKKDKLTKYIPEVDILPVWRKE